MSDDNDVLMEEVPKKERQESPTLRITDVQSVNSDEPETSNSNTMSFIKVRTPTSINNGSMSKSSAGQILVKRLGSTTIRTVPATAMKQAAKAQLVKMANGSYQTHPAYTTMTPRSIPQAPYPKPVASTLYQSPMDPRDDIIRQLQEQNREMKKMLLECRREANQIQVKMRRWTVVINEVLGKVQRLQSPRMMKAVVQQPIVIAAKPPPPSLVPATTPKTGGTQMKVTARKSTSLPPHPSNDIVFRSPAFPIKSLGSLKLFEGDLRNNEFFEFVTQKLMATISKFKIEKPATLLAYVLQTLINPSLLACMVWDYQESSAHDAAQRLALLKFRRFRELYSRLVNNMSKILYGKNLDPAAVERFLRTKLYSDVKLKQHNVKVQNQMLAQRQAQASLELRKAMLQAEKQQQISEEKPQEDDEKNENDEIEWIPDEKVGESCELGNEILGDEDEEKLEDEEQHPEVDKEDGEDEEQHPESMIEENDFTFLDC